VSVPIRISLALGLLCATFAHAATKSWTGAVSNQWSVGGNWSGGVAPVNGDQLLFPNGAANVNMVNNLSGLSLAGITLTGGSYSLSGNAITLTGNLVETGGAITWNVPTTLAASVTFDPISNLQNTLALGGNTLTISGTHLTGTINGTGNVVIGSGMDLFGGGHINITGNVTLNSGSLNVPSGAAVAATLLTVNGTSEVRGYGDIPATTMNAGTLNIDGFAGIGTLSALGNFSAASGVNVLYDITASNNDILSVVGTVTLSNPTLQVTLPSTIPTVGQTFLIIANDGADAISGTFAGLPENGTFTVSGVTFRISYIGGTGNDAVLTVISAPRAWTGAVNNLWSVGGNWSSGVAPVNGDQLAFTNGAAITTTVNDLVGLSISGVTYTSNINSYHLNGNAITLTGSVTGGGFLLFWNLPTTLAASSSFDPFMIVQNTVSLGGNTLTLHHGQLTGTISGSGNVVIDGNMDLMGTGVINITGNVTLTSGALNVPSGSAVAATLMTVAAGTVSGNGNIPTTVMNGGTLRLEGFSGIGTLTAIGNFSAASGVNMLYDVTASNNDILSVVGAVTLSNPTLQLSLPGTLPGVGQTFLLVANDGADAVSGTFAGLPENSTFTISGVTFRISYAGGTGNDVVLTVLSAPKAWTGAVNNLWSVGGNWNGGVAPVNGDQPTFPSGAANTSMVNDLSGLSLAGLTFTGSFTLTGNALTLTGNVSSIAGINWNVPTTLAAPVTFSEGLSLQNTTALGGNTLTLGGESLSGTINGTGNVVINGGLDLGSGGSINITGNVTLTNGNLHVSSGATIAATLLTVNGGTLIGNGNVPATTMSGGTLDVGGFSFNPDKISTLTAFGNFSAASGVNVLIDVSASASDILSVVGTVTLSNPTLQVAFPATIPAVGQTFLIVANDGTEPVSGTFAGLPENSTLTVSGVTFRITYAGGTGNDVFLIVVNATTTTLLSSKNPTESGETFTLTAHVASSGGTPTGTVSFEEGAVVLGTAPLNGSGNAVLTLQLPAGSHSIVARYLGAATFGSSASAALVQQVNDTTPIPTLSEWMLLLLCIALAIAGATIATKR